MIRFKRFLNEEGTGLASQNKGVMHELLVGKHLNGGHHMTHHEGKSGETPEEVHDKVKSQMTHGDYEKTDERAKSAAHAIKKHIESHGHKVGEVHWTSKPGDLHKSTKIHAEQHEDASDLVVHAHTPEGKKVYHGISLKATDTTKKHIGVANPGAGAMYNPDHILAAHREERYKKYPQFKKGKNKPERKAMQNALPKEDRDHIAEKNKETLRKVAHHIKSHLEKGGTEAIATHLKTHVLASHPTPMEKEGHYHWRVTSHDQTKTHISKTGEKFGHHILNPHSHYGKYTNDHHHLGLEIDHKDGTTLSFKHKGKNIARQQIKFNSSSDPISTLKGNGMPTV